MTRRSSTISLAALSLAIAVGCSAPAPTENEPADEPVHLTFTTFHTRTVPFNQAAIWVMDQVTKRSSGRITFEQHFDGTLIPSVETTSGIADGRADLGTLAHAFTPADFPLSTIADVPDVGWTSNVPALTDALNALFAATPEFEAEYDHNGLHFLTFGPTGQIMLAAKEEPADLAWIDGKSIRASAGSVAWITAAGGNVVALPSIEVYEGLERGIIDATTGVTLDSGVSTGLQDVAPHWVDPGIGSAGAVEFVFSLDSWNELSQADRDLFTEVVSEFPVKLGEFASQALSEACEAIRDEGGSVTEWPESEQEEFRDLLGTALLDPWIVSVEATGLADPEGVIETAAELYQESLAKFADFPTPADLCVDL